MRPIAHIAVLIILLFSVSEAAACGGDGITRGPWTLDHKQYAGRDGLPFLSPGNDTRVNLQLLMMDARAWPFDAPSDSPDIKLLPDYPALFARDDFNVVFARNSCANPGALKPDQTGTPSIFADGEGTRCVSFDSGKQAFAQAAQAEKALSDAEKKALIDARAQMAAACLGKDAAAAPGPSPFPDGAKPSPAARDFAAYLTGAKTFYDGGFDASLSAFRGLAKADNPWLRESANYMVARALLNKAEVGAFVELDGVPEPKISDRESLAAAEAAFNAYLSAYPSGRYAASARGLLRRIYWLSGDKARAAAEYGWQIAHAGDRQANLLSSDLAQEIDSKLPGGADASHDPNLLAVFDLMQMRADARNKPDFAAVKLEAQAADFKGHEALFAYLKAARAYYVDGDHAATLKLLGDASYAQLSPYLAFSREMLRGQAMMAAGQYAQAAEHWTRLLPQASQPWRKEAVELGLAMSWERAGTLDKAFLKDTRVASPRIRAILLRHAAGPILLRLAVADPQSLPAERALARYVLLFKEATRGQYKGFLRDYAPEALAKDDAEKGASDYKSADFLWQGAKEPYACPELKAVIGELAANPGASHGLLCLGEFVRTSGFDGFESQLPAPEELGGGKSIFPGEAFSRGEIYKKLIAAPSTTPRDKAYALYRAVNCYAPAGVNGCGGKDVDRAQRKTWYNLLKSNYGSTPWAQSLKYFW